MIRYLIYALITLVLTALEIYLVWKRNGKEPELALPVKRYGWIIGAGNVLLMALAAFFESSSGICAVWYYGLWTYLFCLTIYDLKFRELPDIWHLFPAVFYVIAWIFGYQPVVFLESLLMTVVLGAVLGLIILLKRDAIGLGDVKLLVLCSMYLGSSCMGMLVRAMFLGFFLTIILLICKKVTTKSGLPFVPFLLLGALLI